MGGRGGAALLLALAACSSTGERDPWRPGAPPTAETVGWIDETPVTYGDVARYLRTKEPEAFARGLEGIVIERITLGEAGPMGVTVPRVLLERETRKRMAAWEENVRTASREQTGAEVDPALWLQRVAGVSVADLRGWIEHHTEIELIQDRLARYDLLTSPHVDVSLILVEGEERAGSLATEAKGGADFATLAKANSVHPSAAEGGRIPGALVPGDVGDAAVRQALFAAKQGDVVGPFASRGPDQGGTFEVYRVDACVPARQGSYKELAREVTRDLETRPVDVAEYERWRTRVLVRHGFLAAEGGPQ
ncbi:MAG TPA: peptidylprolyl isomerase [Planctomycetota bacterium]|nr:peptidylprolyl isomerase [Planctomycetota bacterium]